MVRSSVRTPSYGRAFQTSLTLLIVGTKLLKCLEGQYNKAFILTMDNGMEVLAKLPNPNAGPKFFTTASEVATREFVCPYIPFTSDFCTFTIRHSCYESYFC
jgi:hypothetical protein